MMIRTFLLSACLFFSGFVTAQEAPNKTDASGKKQGLWIKLDENKKKIYEGNFVDNIPVGKFVYYYDTGTPWAITVFSEKGKVGRTQHFNAAGKVVGEGKYVNEKKDSIWKFYNEDGILISDEQYKVGVKDGPARVYYTNGQIAEEKFWKNGKLNGPCKKYFETGQLKYNGQYIDDKVEGKVTYYQVSGKVDAEGVYKNDLKEGAWKYYNADGSIKRTDVYVNGKMTGTDKDIIPKKQQDEEKKKYEQFEIKDPYQEGYDPR